MQKLATVLLVVALAVMAIDRGGSVQGAEPNVATVSGGEVTSFVRDEAASGIDSRQGWNDERRQWFYHLANQGSHLVPYDWFLWLKQSASDHLLRENEHIGGGMALLIRR